MIRRFVPPIALAALLLSAAALPAAAQDQEPEGVEPDVPILDAADQFDLPPIESGFSCPAGCRVNQSSGPVDYANLLDVGGAEETAGAASATAAALCAFTTATLTTLSCTSDGPAFNPACLAAPSANEVTNPRTLELRSTTALGPCDVAMFAPYLRTAQADLYLNEGTLLKPGLCPAGDRCAPIYVGNLFTGNGQIDLPSPPFLALGDDEYISGRLPQVETDERHAVEVVSRNAFGEARTRFNLVILNVD